MEVFFWFSFSSMILSSFSLLLGFSGTWILYFPLTKASVIFFLLMFREICSLSGYTVVILAPGLDILERLGLSLLTFIFFGFSRLILLSDKLADEIYLYLCNVFTLSNFSVLWESLDLSNDLYLSNDIPLFDSLLIDLYFLLWDACGLSVSFMASFCFLCNEWWLYPPQYVLFTCD